MTPTKTETIAVVGGGLGGLAASCVLAARGYEVTLFERNPWLGGKAAVLEGEGYRFDMGPTIITLPSVLRRIFAEGGRDLDAELPMVRLDPQWRCFFEDGSRLDLLEKPEAMAAALETFRGGRGLGDGFLDFMALSKTLHEITDRYFFYQAIGSLGDTFRLPGVSRLTLLQDLLRLRMGSTFASTLRRYLKDGRVFQMAEHFTQYVGSNPQNAPPILCGIAHMQSHEGISYPKDGGIRAVPEALVRFARALGVQMRPATRVTRILVAAGAAAGVELENGSRESFDAVVSNMDSVRTHRELLGGEAAARFERRRRYEPACSGVVLYLGLSKGYDHLLHHDFVFSRNTEEEYEAIYGKGEPAPDPSCYLCAPARTDPSVAPAGGEALYVLVHTPHLRDGHRWKEWFPGYRKTILAKLARTAGLTDLEDRIVFERALTPEDIHGRYSVLQGAIYGLASHGRFFGAFKPGNRSPDVKGLYLAGGSAHPGPGMPMALMSGWIAADALDADRGGVTPSGSGARRG